MSTALIMGLDVMATLFGVYTFGAFFTVTITFEVRRVRGGEGNSSYWPSIMQNSFLIGCTAWFDNKREHLPAWLVFGNCFSQLPILIEEPPQW